MVAVPALAWCLIFYPLHKPDIFIEVQSFNISVQNIKCFNYGGGLVFWDKIFILPKINTKILSVQPPLRKYLNPMDWIENLYFVDIRYSIYVLKCHSVYLLFWQRNERALLDTVFWQILSNSSWLVSTLSTDRESGSINSPTRNGATNGLNSLHNHLWLSVISSPGIIYYFPFLRESSLYVITRILSFSSLPLTATPTPMWLAWVVSSLNSPEKKYIQGWQGDDYTLILDTLRPWPWTLQ